MSRIRNILVGALLGLAMATGPASAQFTIDFKKPILSAIEAGDAERVKQILLKGESPNTVDTRGWPILIVAVNNGNPEVVRVLVQGGALTEVPDNFGNTALLRAAENDDVAVAEILIKHGAKVDAQNRQGTTPLMVAANHGTLDLIDLLLRHKASVNRRQHAGARRRQGMIPAAAASRSSYSSDVQRGFDLDGFAGDSVKT